MLRESRSAGVHFFGAIPGTRDHEYVAVRASTVEEDSVLA